MTLWVGKMNRIINETRAQTIQNKHLQEVHDFERARKLFLFQIFKLESYLIDSDFKNVVKSLMTLANNIDRYDNGQEKFEVNGPEIAKIVKNCENKMRESLRDLCSFSKTDEFLKFAYELRKADTEDKYSARFLKPFVEMPVLYQIIMANSFNNDCMEFDHNKLRIKLMKSQS